MKNLSGLVEKAHSNAEEKGFHNDWTLRQKLALIITELGEAIEADRKGNYAGEETLKYFLGRCDMVGGFRAKSFENNIKDSFEDELADSLIRIFDLIGLLKLPTWKIEKRIESARGLSESDSLTEKIFEVMREIVWLGMNPTTTGFGSAIAMILAIAEEKNIDIEKHVELKMNYNETRERLHGKNY